MKHTDLLHHHTDEPCAACAEHERESAKLATITKFVGYGFDLVFLGFAIYYATRGAWGAAWSWLVLGALWQIERNTRRR